MRPVGQWMILASVIDSVNNKSNHVKLVAGIESF